MIRQIPCAVVAVAALLCAGCGGSGNGPAAKPSSALGSSRSVTTTNAATSQASASASATTATAVGQPPAATNSTGGPSTLPAPCTLLTINLARQVIPDAALEHVGTGCMYANGRSSDEPVGFLSLDVLGAAATATLVSRLISSWESQDGSGGTRFERLVDLGDRAACVSIGTNFPDQSTVVVQRLRLRSLRASAMHARLPPIRSAACR